MYLLQIWGYFAHFTLEVSYYMISGLPNSSIFKGFEYKSTGNLSCHSLQWPRAALTPIVISKALVQPTHKQRINYKPHIQTDTSNAKRRWREKEDINSVSQDLLQYLVSRDWRHVGRHRRLHSHYPVAHWIWRRIIPRKHTVFQMKAQLIFI